MDLQPGQGDQPRRPRPAAAHDRHPRRHHRAQARRGSDAPGIPGVREQQRGHAGYRRRQHHHHHQSGFHRPDRVHGRGCSRQEAGHPQRRPSRSRVLRNDVAGDPGYRSLAGRDLEPPQERRRVRRVDQHQHHLQGKGRGVSAGRAVLRPGQKEGIRKADLATGQLRSADRPAQSPHVPRAPGAGNSPRPAHRRFAGVAVPRPGPVQGSQRRARARSRRPAAAAGRTALARLRPRSGGGGAPGRRRVCRDRR